MAGDRPERGQHDRRRPVHHHPAVLADVYDYLGYYNICHLGEEVRDPGRTIPRAVIGSVLIVAAMYLLMNVALSVSSCQDENATTRCPVGPAGVK